MKMQIAVFLLLSSALVPGRAFCAESREMEEGEKAQLEKIKADLFASILEKDYPIKFADLRKTDPDVDGPNLSADGIYRYSKQLKAAPVKTTVEWRAHFREYIQDKTSAIGIEPVLTLTDNMLLFEGPHMSYNAQGEGSLQFAHRLAITFLLTTPSEKIEATEVFDLIPPCRLEDGSDDPTRPAGVLLRRTLFSRPEPR